MNGTLRDFVKQRRAELGLTQAELAERAGVNQPVISDIERGATKMPDADRRRKIARALGVSHVDLLVAAGELLPDELRASGSEGVVERAPDDPGTRLIETAKAINWLAVPDLVLKLIQGDLDRVMDVQQDHGASDRQSDR